MACHAELREVLDHAREEHLLLASLERSGADLAAFLAREPRLAASQWAA